MSYLKYLKPKIYFIYVKMNKSSTDNRHILESIDANTLLDELSKRLMSAQKNASMSKRSTAFSPIEEAGQRIRDERKKQGLTLNDLCELSGIAYATLNKLEQGHPSARLDSLGSVARALGMKLWIG